MTEFETRISEVLASLQPGEVVSYGEVAEQAGFPRAARAVGTFLRTTDLQLPWWRVVGADRTLRSPDPHRQAALLAAEEVRVVAGRVVDAVERIR